MDVDKSFLSFKAIFLFFIIIPLTSCMVGPDFESPEAPKVDTYTEQKLPTKTTETAVQGGKAQTFAMGQDIPAQWWTLFHSPELNRLIEQGIENNPTLQAALATLQQAEENLKAQVGATMLPLVAGNFTDQRIKYPPFSTTSGITSAPPPINTFLTQPIPPFNLYNATVNVSYTLDIFGGNRRAIENLMAQVDYQRYELEAAYLTLTSNIVTTAISEASYRAQIKATQDIIDAEAKQLEITQKQFELGGVAEQAVLALKTQLEQTRATLPTLEKNLAYARSALATLVGAFPGTKSLPTFHLENLHLPTELPVSIPSELVKQRPDIQAAEALLHASTAQIGVTTANLLPSVNLTGLLGSESGFFDLLFGPNTKIYNWEAAVMQTFFNGGALIARREASIAAFEASYAQYQQAVLTAFKNVSDSLSAIETDSRTLNSTYAAELAAKKNMDLIQEQYFLGGTSYLALLYAQMQYHQAYLSRVTAEAARYADTAALFQAMGGGWWNRKDEITEIQQDDVRFNEEMSKTLLIDYE